MQPCFLKRLHKKYSRQEKDITISHGGLTVAQA